MPYHFKLETILNLRRNFEEQACLKLAGEQRTLDNHSVFLTGLRTERTTMIAEMEERKKKRMTGAMYSLYVEGIGMQDWRIQVQRNTVEAQKQVLMRVREELAEAVKQRKMIEKIREKDYLNYQSEELRREQNENDEQAVLRHNR
ncbi:MAG: flagellar export protein FliJ [Desulfobulbaceae bacterium]|nr:flagellar export protein FliJ [Desulfobulbaceae bacterium]